MKGLRARIVLMGLLCGILGLLVSRSLARAAAEEMIGRFAGRTLLGLMAHGERQRCEAEPSSWSLEATDFASGYAYDASSLRSFNPAAPALEVELVSRADAAPSSPIAVKLREGRGGVLVLRSSNAGACALLQLSWRPVATPTEAMRATLTGGLAVGLGSILASLGIVIYPAARRVTALRRAAARVGDPTGYEPADARVDDDFGRLARELDHAHARIRRDASELERQRAALEEHLANVAHDLRTPIASLLLALEQAATAATKEAAEEPLTRALTDVVYVRGLTENLRLASKYGSSAAYDMAVVFDLGAALTRSVDRARFLARRKGVALEVAVPERDVPVRADPIGIEQALGNVIDNAVTHGTGGGHVAVVLRRAQEGRFVLTVVDDGPGVQLSDLPKLGERTFRSDEARRRDPRGSGLGLAITAEVARRSGWAMHFEREDPTGLRVVLNGPIVVDDEPPVA